MFVLEADRAARGQAGNANAADDLLAVQDHGHGVAPDGDFHLIPLPEWTVCALARRESSLRVTEAGLAQFPKFTAANRITKQIRLRCKMTAHEHPAVAGIQHALAQDHTGGSASFESVRVDDRELLPFRRVHPTPIEAQREVTKLAVGPEMLAVPVVFDHALVEASILRRALRVSIRLATVSAVPSHEVAPVEERLKSLRCGSGSELARVHLQRFKIRNEVGELLET